MSKKGKKADVGRIYRQQVLSGYERAIQPGNKDGGSEENKQVEDVASEDISQEGCYLVSVTFIVDKVGNDGNGNLYNISVNDDSDLLITPVSKRSKKPTKPTVTVHQEKSAKTTKIPMVYGIHQEGQYTLSLASEHTLPRAIASIYSFILVQANRAIERTLFKPTHQEANDDTRERAKGSLTQEDVGANKTARRGKKIRSEVLPKTAPETTAKVDEIDRPVLGG